MSATVEMFNGKLIDEMTAEEAIAALRVAIGCWVDANARIKATHEFYADLLRQRFERTQEATMMRPTGLPDCGHGHVYPAGGRVARCGGPGLCKLCSRDQAALLNSAGAAR